MAFVAILGASGTVGSCLARELTRQHESVLLLGRSPEKLSPLAAELNQPWAAVDPHDAGSLESAILSHVPSLGPLRAIVNAVGSVLLKPAHLTTDDEFREVIETNLFTAFAAVKVAGRVLRENGGSVVLFASAAAAIGIPNHEAIAAAKAGIVGLARSAAATYAPSNIRVNVVSPGLVKTELTRRIWSSPAASAASTELHALGRLGEPQQIVSLVKWLLDPAHDWITGQTIGLDGGLGSVLPAKRPARHSAG